MKDRTRLIRTPNARIAPFCEICGRVDGPLPFGRGEVVLTYHVEGARCQDHPLPVREAIPCLSSRATDRVLDAFLESFVDSDDAFSSFIQALEG